MKIRISKKFIVPTILFVVFLLVGNFIINRYIETKKEYYLNVQSKLLATKYQTNYKYYKIMSKDVYDMYEQKKKLIALLSKAAKTSDPKKKDYYRKAVYKLLKKNYRRLTNMGITQIHFHTKDNKSFLRMYAPNEYGDDLSTTRPTVVLTNKTKKPHEGFESCKYMVGYRFVYPLFNAKKEHIGSVEISYSATQILNNVADKFSYDAHILVSKDIAPRTIIENTLGVNYKKTWESPDYLLEESSHKHLQNKNFYEKLDTPKIRQQIAKGIASKKVFSIYAKYNYNFIVITFLPLQDVHKRKNIAYIVTYNESDYLGNIDIENDYIKALFFTIATLLYLFSLYVIFNREKLKELALFDNLTKLPNRTLFMIELQNELNRAQRYKNRVGLLFIDLDGFKSVNDTYGHQMGDELLKEVAQRLTKAVRKTDIVSRLSGDEFTVIVSGIQDPKEVENIAKKVLEAVNEEIIIDHQVLPIGASIGIAIYPDHTKDIDELIKLADDMMYRSKAAGKNQISMYSDE